MSFEFSRPKSSSCQLAERNLLYAPPNILSRLLLLQDAVMVENMHDIPYLPSGQLGPEVTSTLAVVCAEVSKVFYPGPVGVQVLAAANHQALAIAKAAGEDVCLLVDPSNNPSIPCNPSINLFIHPSRGAGRSSEVERSLMV